MTGPSSRASVSTGMKLWPSWRKCGRLSRTYTISTISESKGVKGTPPPNIPKYPSSQPPSHKPPEFRKSQLLRQYASLLRSAPMMLLFQHNNLKAGEWLALRRELTKAFRKTDQSLLAAENTSQHALADSIKIQTVQGGIFGAALRVVEYYRPNPSAPLAFGSSTPSSSESRICQKSDEFTHVLSKAAHEAASRKMTTHGLTPLLSGPLCILSFPAVSPEHLKQAISILHPSPPNFPAPRRRENPGWHDPAVQAGVQKLVLLGGRIENRVLDIEGTKTVGGIIGGLDGLRGQLVSTLQCAGVSVASTLENTGKSIYFTLEGRRNILEDEAKTASGDESSSKIN
ncbi:BgTH12-07160 [Blumeria graminis f. sp. triticale]|uniref:Bgt-3970 n=3 Tax=Blumeria graminis TaxID=34373 RepID=A0A061HPP0_BLUGR|nr:hypothetical protein BGT96224_3970 [Blumeria graminis f. sp. tritici 96224]CAD6506233.1 BgTH12-07160 [Blumeria graminis f. sp. triticale]VDB94988.1 Bgt-3970 [Blumeria graminis f. sp. tritici]